MAIIYTHTRLDTNQMFYIGIGKDLERAYSKIGRNRYWKHIVKNSKYRIDIIFSGLTWEQACYGEQELIRVMGRKDIGAGVLVNMTDGGDGLMGFKHSEEHKRKMSQQVKGKNNPMFGKTGLLNPFYGKNHSEESKRLMSNSLKGRLSKLKGVPRTKHECIICGQMIGSLGNLKQHINSKHPETKN